MSSELNWHASGRVWSSSENFVECKWVVYGVVHPAGSEPDAEILPSDLSPTGRCVKTSEETKWVYQIMFYINILPSICLFIYIRFVCLCTTWWPKQPQRNIYSRSMLISSSWIRLKLPLNTYILLHITAFCLFLLYIFFSSHMQSVSHLSNIYPFLSYKAYHSTQHSLMWFISQLYQNSSLHLMTPSLQLRSKLQCFHSNSESSVTVLCYTPEHRRIFFSESPAIFLRSSITHISCIIYLHSSLTLSRPTILFHISCPTTPYWFVSMFTSS